MFHEDDGLFKKVFIPAKEFVNQILLRVFHFKESVLKCLRNVSFKALKNWKWDEYVIQKGGALLIDSP